VPVPPELELSFFAGSEAVDPESPSLSLPLFAVDEERDERASFLAHPEPLKTIAGEDMSLRVGPPQRSQRSGPDALTPCITSRTWPQFWHW